MQAEPISWQLRLIYRGQLPFLNRGVRYLPPSGDAGTKQLTVSVTENTSGAIREAIITFTSGSLSKQVKVVQAKSNDVPGMMSDALVLAKKMTLGWNLGNALEASMAKQPCGNPKPQKH